MSIIADGFHEAGTLDRLMQARRSIRAFLPQPVDGAPIDAILRISARALSGSNSQPWRVHVLSANTLRRLVDAVCAAFNAEDGTHRPEYDYDPREVFERYLGRRRKVGWDLQGLLGIATGDVVRTRAQHRRNFEFFGAPVGLMFSIDRRPGQGSLLDCGVFLQNVMLAAGACGLATCAQAAWIDYHRIIGEILRFDADEQLECGVALGYADPDGPGNSLLSERANPSEFVVSHD